MNPFCKACGVVTVVTAVFCGTASTAFAQNGPAAPVTGETPESTTPAPQKRFSPSLGGLFKDTAADFRRLPSRQSVSWLLVGAAFAATAHSADAPFATKVAGASSHSEAFEAGRIMGGAQFQFGAALATYGVGRLTGKTRVAEVGSHLLRAQIVAQTVTQAVKFSVKRLRPDGSTRNSFPSGHTSVSFASATVLQREFGWKVGIPAYAVASYIGYSRIEHKRHYLSDVIFGAAIGVVSGRSITVGRGDKRFLVSPVATKGGGGVSFVWAGQR